MFQSALHSFFGWIIFSIIDSLQFVYTFICWWTFKLFLLFGYCDSPVAFMQVQVFVLSTCFQLCWHTVYPEVVLWGHMVVLCLIFEEQTYLSGLKYFIGIPHFSALLLSLQIMYFYKLNVCGNPASASLAAPLFQQHFLTFCLCVTFW